MRRIVLGFVLVCLVMALAACGSKPTESNQGNGGQANSKPPETTTKVLLYYSNSDLTAIEKEEREITYQNESEKYEKAMKELGKATEQGHEPLWANFAYHSIKLENGQLTIDADSNNQYQFGSSGEAMAIEVLRMTMFQFPEVSKISILVDGEPAESLMGHVDISKPLERSPL